jgi:hypothetical protein
VNPRGRVTESLSDAEIAEIALQLRAAMDERPPDDPHTSILSRARELPAGDEDRVITALDALRERES